MTATYCSHTNRTLHHRYPQDLGPWRCGQHDLLSSWLSARSNHHMVTTIVCLIIHDNLPCPVSRYVNKSPVETALLSSSSQLYQQSHNRNSPLALISQINNTDTTVDLYSRLVFTLQEYHFHVSSDYNST